MLRSSLSVALFPEDVVYRIGVFSQFTDPAATRYWSGRDPLIDSTGVPVDEAMLADLTTGLCGVGVNGAVPDDGEPRVFGLNLDYNANKTEHEAVNRQFSSLTAQQGYVCEKDDTWECPTGYAMMMGKCYKIVHTSKMRMAAELECQKEGGTLAKPTTMTHVHFLVELLRESEEDLHETKKITTRYWTGFLREVDGTADPFQIFSDFVQVLSQIFLDLYHKSPKIFPSQPCNCNGTNGDIENMYYARGRCYRKVPEQLKFNHAVERCQNFSGTLAYGRTQEEVDGYKIFFTGTTNSTLFLVAKQNEGYLSLSVKLN